MEAGQDREIVAVVDDSGCSNVVVKGKRTKRQRQPSPLPFQPRPTVPVTTDVSSTATSSSEQSTCTVEEDMANCLILLAREAAVEQRGVFVYECKTCGRGFNSFQALGGHRASHKRPRTAGGDGGGAEENNNNNNQNSSKVLVKTVDQKLREGEGGAELALSLRIVSTAAVNDDHNNPPATTAVAKPSKVHECAICGAGFSSGQALGGHMRRHRTVVPVPPAAALTTTTAARNGLELDLNLPAPEDGVDGRETNNKFRFPAQGLQLVFTAASPMVDCHF
ncbi:unnamed protein product [Linum tenue]|uniref:C2H2-type domain-containing protein n=1 Tax=Linum tenue TaxID=586396 RepID=A0AAV0JD76_9ROSI|nr:unnamed protein product [Linum tenue]